LIIVSNTSPISNLAKVGQLNLMQKLYGTILIPCAVHEELLDERAGETVVRAVQSATWLEIRLVTQVASYLGLREKAVQ
jgi:predicted nucleic acid-binding protein